MFVFTEKEGVLKIMLRGDIDHNAVTAIREEIDGLIFAHKPKTVVLDMSAVTFCDSSAIALVIGRHKRVSAYGGTLVLDRVPRGAMRIFRLAGLEKIITVKTGEGK